MARKKSREQKKREKQTRFARLEDRRWEPIQKLLSLLGLPPSVLRLAQANKRFRERSSRPPEILLDPSASCFPEAGRLGEEIRSVLETVSLDADASVSASDFLLAGLPVYSFLSRLELPSARQEEVELQARVREAAAQLRNVHLNNLMTKLLPRLELSTIAHSRIDSKLFWVTTDIVRSSHAGEKVFQARVYATPCQRRQVIGGGDQRPAYRSGGGFENEGVRWASWDAKALGIGGPRDRYDVYVQAHALDRLHLRICIIPDYEVHDAMVLSLDEPVVVESRGRELLIEYRFFNYRLGYFVAEQVEDIVLVRTFLFLTMQGTPEARLLWEKFGLRRPDIEYLDLDNLYCFLLTDLPDDPELVRKFEECGCGHLLRMGRPELRDQARRGNAQRMREYLLM
jgi:hypothetical protein